MLNFSPAWDILLFLMEMSSKNIRIVVILAVISIVGISIAQYTWFRKAFDLRDKQFDYNVSIALKNVGESITRYNESPPMANNPVNQVSGNYFVVRINDAIDANLLEQLLINQFSDRGLNHNFEYGIYDCTHEKMVYGSYISMNASNSPGQKGELPKWEDDSYYFGVYFPDKQFYLLGQMNIWLFSTLVLLIVMLFFAYTLFIILRQKRLSEVQNDFINNMTHEFKTPISTISISSEVLQTSGIEQNPEKLGQYAGIIHQESQRLKSQVERILQMARSESTGETYNFEEIDLHDLLQESATLFADKFIMAGGYLKTEFDSRNLIVFGDRLHLSNCFFNLIDNALKYKRDKPVLYIRTKAEGKTLHIAFQDEGLGIDKKYQGRIFQRFFRIPTGNIHETRGFGLGLNYVKNIMRKHKGSIGLKSEAGKGSTFTLTLPIHE